MSERNSHDLMNEDTTLGAALRELPSEAPPRDMWPLVKARARRRRRMRHGGRIALPAALAAGLALAIWLPMRHAATQQSPSRTTPVATHSTDHHDVRQLAQWRRHSQRLQTLVQRLDKAGTPLSGRALANAADLQDQIGMVDLQLNVARSPRAQLPLWRQRVFLLKRLATLHLMADSAHIARMRSPTSHTLHWYD